MPTLRNTTDEYVTLPFGHEIGPYGDLTLSQGDMARIAQHGAVRGALGAGRLVMAEDPPPTGLELTRTGIARAKRVDLEGLAKAHGVTAEEIAGMNVDELREAVASLVLFDV